MYYVSPRSTMDVSCFVIAWRKFSHTRLNFAYSHSGHYKDTRSNSGLLDAQHSKLIDLLVRCLSMPTFAKKSAYEKLIVTQVVDKFYAVLPTSNSYYPFRSPIYLAFLNEIWHRRPEPKTFFVGVYFWSVLLNASVYIVTICVCLVCSEGN
jgi:hypothetical protein